MNPRLDRRAPMSYLAVVVAVLVLFVAACAIEQNDVEIDDERVAETGKSAIELPASLSCVYAARESGKNPTPADQQMQQRGECARLRDDGSVAVAAEHLTEMQFRDGIAWLAVPGMGWFYVLPEGRTASVIEFDNGPDYFEEGLARTERAGKIGFIDTSLSEVIAPRWDFASAFHQGVAVVCTGCSAAPIGDGEHSEMRGGVWGYINRDGEVVVPVEYERDQLPRPPSVK